MHSFPRGTFLAYYGELCYFVIVGSLTSVQLWALPMFHKKIDNKKVVTYVLALKNSNSFCRDCLVQALIQLLQTKSLSNITISELTECAGVSRMTYYRNYQSIDEIFENYLADLVAAYRQDVAAWPDKGNYNDYRNMLHCYQYFYQYREFIACLVKTGLGHLLLQALDGYILDTYYTEDKGRDFYYTLRAFSGSLYNIYVTWILEDAVESAEEIVSIICKIYS